MAISNNKAWYNKAYISVSPEGGSEVQLTTKTTSLTISGGNFDIEGLKTFGGTIKRVGEREDIEISFDGVPTSHQDFDWMFHGLTTNTSGNITSSDVKDYRVTVLWTDQSGITSATQAINTTSEAYREIYAETNMVSLEKSMDADGHLTAAMAFKLPYEDSDGVINFKKEYCDTTSALTVIAAYTSAVKF
jgi:hypothetical protein